MRRRGRAASTFFQKPDSRHLRGEDGEGHLLGKQALPPVGHGGLDGRDQRGVIKRGILAHPGGEAGGFEGLLDLATEGEEVLDGLTPGR